MCVTDHNHTPEEERRIREAALDETIAESFPASDPPSSLPNPDEHDAEGLGTRDVLDNVDLSRFEIVTGEGTAHLDYVRRPGEMVFTHTEVPTALRGRGLADLLAAFGLKTARDEGRRIVAQCPFVRKYMQKHPEGAGTGNR
jgi:predicted GNAT family acetyltransferase